MGSLMSGWDSPVREKFMRSKSLTRDEIAAFWRFKEEKEEEHLRDKQKVVVVNGDEEDERIAERLMSESLEEKLLEKHGWWISSKWAFLNQPPVLKPEPQGHQEEFAAASQLHVAS